MFQNRVFNLDSTHRPTRRNNHIIGATAMKEIPFSVYMPKIFGGKPLALAPDLDLANDIGRAGHTCCVLDLYLRTGDGLAERPLFLGKIFGARIAH